MVLYPFNNIISFLVCNRKYVMAIIKYPYSTQMNLQDKPLPSSVECLSLASQQASHAPLQLKVHVIGGCRERLKSISGCWTGVGGAYLPD